MGHYRLARCSVGQAWKNEDCVDGIKNFIFEEAQKQANGGWSVQTKDGKSASEKVMNTY